ITEVDLVLVNDESVDLRHVIKENDRISVYPVFESFDISSVTRVRDQPLRQSRFVLDCHLGKLAYYLRMLGFDTLYRPDFHDHELISISNNEQRILLSRDRKMIEESSITRGYRVRETDPKLQAVEILRRFDLFHVARPLQRCLRCNDVLQPIAKEAVLARLPPMIRERYEEFQACPKCNRVYWKGSHYQWMQAFIAKLLAEDPSPNRGN
ncbi:MAG TPA: Mut7-C RNAse domain-containing protein, partial [Verrucomicrobiae bacterium]|nr:Mut7-C RNAse domain-containing protein [Verrucomicrobiae bacterium]